MIAAGLLLGSGAHAADAPHLAFALDGARSGYTDVTADHLYEPGTYGYEATSKPGDRLFSVAVPEGVYRVRLTFGDRPGAVTVKAENRRLMLFDVPTGPGHQASREFLVPVRTPALAPPPPNAPGGAAVRISDIERKTREWDDRLTLELLGDGDVSTISINPVDAPTVFLAGDSTVTDQPYEPTASWGQMLPAMIDDTVAVDNHAWSGETLKSFLTELRLDKVLALAKPGDWLLIQFGHNDQKANWPQTYADPRYTYPAYLKAYIAEARRRGMHPILVTSPERRMFQPDGTLKHTLADYVDAMKRVAAEEGVSLIDLNAASRRIYETLGPERASLAFNDGGRDLTHNDNYGAWMLARVVAAGLTKAAPTLAAHVQPAFRAFDPAHPPLPGTIAIPASGAHSDIRPAGN
ncbi:rhamnogalacturonan acetylesterase [Hephaestia mangrovi]|uniref:rhamnogalacturonan acetylesterase n=1 Tax=Hephaestia mangrovi TaxID=2873268 RepID=UPI001CA73C8F|nr:rhamnogalacturonan acetylesterase [Hephaestia mangrovi]MBY8829660.1 rhamnogalacturonan acetylesterase [Hephaestia mangrovi]